MPALVLKVRGAMARQDGAGVGEHAFADGVTGVSQMSADKPQNYGPVQAATKLGMSRKAWQRAREAGLVPQPDSPGGRWSAAAISALGERAGAILDMLGPDPLGASRATLELGERFQMPVNGGDTELLAARGLVAVAGEHQGWPLYDRRDLDALPAEALAAVIAEREAWAAGTCSSWEAAARLGWRPEDFERVASERLTPAGRGRWLRTDVEVLGSDSDLAAELQPELLLGPDQAAERLEIRRVDWDYIVAAEWIMPTTFCTVMMEHRNRPVEVPLYRMGDIDELLHHPGINWDELRACLPGTPSPLRRGARRWSPRSRAVHQWVEQMSARWATEVWATYNMRWDWWQIYWQPSADGHPTKAELTAALNEDPNVSSHRNSIRLLEGG